METQIVISKDIVWTLRAPTIEEIALEHHWSVSKLDTLPANMEFRYLSDSTIKIPKRILKRVEVLDPEKRYWWYIGEEDKPDIPWGRIAKASLIAVGGLLGAVVALVALSALIAVFMAVGSFVLMAGAVVMGLTLVDPCLIAIDPDNPEGPCYSVWRRWELI